MVFGSHTVVPINWMCKKQTSVSHSSTESEIISLDAGLRLDGIPALDLWDLIFSVLGNTIQNHDRTAQPVDPNVLASTARESPGQTKSESHNVPLSSLNEQQTRLVMGASSSNYSERNFDDKWSSQEWKSGEMLGARTERPVDDKFVIDDDMDSDTVTESNFSPRSRSFLNRVNDRLRNPLDHFPEGSMPDIDKRSMIWRMFMSSCRSTRL